MSQDYIIALEVDQEHFHQQDSSEPTPSRRKLAQSSAGEESSIDDSNELCQSNRQIKVSLRYNSSLIEVDMPMISS